MKIKFTELIKESRLLSEGRKEDARERYPIIPDRVFNKFVEGDPSGNHKYISWVTKKWWEERCERAEPDSWRFRNYCDSENTASSLMKDIQYYHEKGHKYTQNSIDDFPNIRTLINVTQEARLTLSKSEMKKQANKLYETDRYLVVEPTSHATSCYYGSGTRWCTTMRNSPNYYNNYVKDNSLIYFINKRTGKKRAFLTPLNRPMFGPGNYGSTNWLYAGEKEYDNFSGQIFTETDNQGRSLRGIPEEARIAMQNGHIAKAKKWVLNLGNEQQKIRQMRQMGMDDIPELETLDRWDTNQGPVPAAVTSITGDLTVRDRNMDFGNLQSVNKLNINVEGTTTISGIENVNNIVINSGSVDLGSVSGSLESLVLGANGRLRKADNIRSIGLVKLKSLNIYKTLLNGIEIGRIEFNLASASEALSKLFKDTDVRIDRWG
jgi:hypothetical protein